MIKRNCLACGKAAYSANKKEAWVCPYCSAKIPPEKTYERRMIDEQKVKLESSSFTREINLKQ